jgi:hypothetical protein
VPRRMRLPAADELFRRTAPDLAAVPDQPDQPAEPTSDGAARWPSGRVRHEEKMTVYITADELLDLEHARLALRRDYGLAVDRGRLVREAVAITLADYDLNGEDSVLVRLLGGT